MSYGLFEIVTQTDHIPLLTMKDCSETYYDRNFEANQSTLRTMGGGQNDPQHYIFA